jgi:hypothetical protein
LVENFFTNPNRFLYEEQAYNNKKVLGVGKKKEVLSKKIYFS